MTFEDLEKAMRGVVEIQRINSESLGNLIRTVEASYQRQEEARQRQEEARQQQEESHLRLEESHQRQEESHNRLEASIQRYVDAANARMKQMEQNLDALIRIITAEHSNGKGQG